MELRPLTLLGVVYSLDFFIPSTSIFRMKKYVKNDTLIYLGYLKKFKIRLGILNSPPQNRVKQLVPIIYANSSDLHFKSLNEAECCGSTSVADLKIVLFLNN